MHVSRMLELLYDRSDALTARPLEAHIRHAIASEALRHQVQAARKRRKHEAFLAGRAPQVHEVLHEQV